MGILIQRWVDRLYVAYNKECLNHVYACMHVSMWSRKESWQVLERQNKWKNITHERKIETGMDVPVIRLKISQGSVHHIP